MCIVYTDDAIALFPASLDNLKKAAQYKAHLNRDL